MNPRIDNAAMKMGAGDLPAAPSGLAWLGGLPWVPPVGSTLGEGSCRRFAAAVFGDIALSG